MGPQFCGRVHGPGTDRVREGLSAFGWKAPSFLIFRLKTPLFFPLEGLFVFGRGVLGGGAVGTNPVLAANQE